MMIHLNRERRGFVGANLPRLGELEDAEKAEATQSGDGTTSAARARVEERNVYAGDEDDEDVEDVERFAHVLA